MTLDPNSRQVLGQVGVAPSPATSGVDWSIDHLLDYFGNPFEQTVPFKVTVYPRGEQPTKQNSEVILVQAYASSTRTGNVAITETVAGHAASASVDVQETQAGDSTVPQSSIQQLTIDATSGTFTLTFSTGTTSAIAWNAEPNTIQAALTALTAIGAGNCVVYFVTPPMLATVLALPSLKLYWRLGEAAGATTAADSSGNGNTGTYGAGCTLGQAGMLIGDPTTGVTLSNTSTGRVTSSYAPFVVGSSRTFMGWANRAATTDADCLFGGDAGASSPRLIISGGSLNVTFAAAATGTASWSTSPWPGTGQDVHWALTYNDTTNVAELFINGVSQGTKTLGAGYGATLGNFEAGSFTSGTNPFNGKMQGVAVCETILTAAQILGVYNAGKNPPAPAPCTITFQGTLANAAQPLITADPTNLVTGSAGSASVVETTLGGVAGSNEVQTITLVGTSGTFTLSFGGQTTNALPFNATGDAVSTELQALSSVGSGNVSVEGGICGPYTVTFQGTLGGAAQSLITADATLLVMNGEAERQVIGIDGDGGTWRLSADGGSTWTGNFNWNAVASAVQTGLQAQAAIGSGNCVVTYDSTAMLYTVTWCGALATASPSLLVADATALTLTTSHVTACLRAQDNTTARTIIVGDQVEVTKLNDWNYIEEPGTGVAFVFNNYDLGAAGGASNTILSFTNATAAGLTLTGIMGGSSGRRIAIRNFTGGTLTLSFIDGRSSAGNLIASDVGTGASLILATGEMVELIYIPTGTGSWWVIAREALATSNNYGLARMEAGGSGSSVADASLVVHKANTETITGSKTFTALTTAPQIYETAAAATYGVTVTPNARAAPWQTITVTNGTAFTIASPSNPPTSTQTAELTIEVKNSSGGAMGAITWSAAFAFAGFTWTNPANGNHRYARFEWNGANWICTAAATADY